MSDASARPTRTPATVRVGFISLGCAKNLVDTEIMLGHLDGAGCTLVREPAEADVLVVNTCGFVEAAREESIRTILEAAQFKKTGRLRRLVVAGCMVQRYAEELGRDLPEVDAFLGLDELDRVVEGVCPELRARRDRPGHRWTTARGPARFLYDEQTPRLRATPSWTAYVKIAEGCDHTCSFCAIPSFRGVFRSRRPDGVVAEARALASAGVREISLISQDTSHYGRDLGMTEGLPSLLVDLDGVEELRWIRLHYLYPNTVTGRLIDTMARLPRVVEYVDLPLQHAHAGTLRRMRRGGSGDTHLRLLRRFREAMPEVALRTTLIVGFPGESEEEFRTLLDFVDEARFDHLGVFTYSHEEGTPAAEVADDVPSEVKEERWTRLMELQAAIARERNERHVGRTVEVLAEGAHGETEHLLVGRMRTQALDVDGQVIINDGMAAPGEFVAVEITQSAGYDLVGRVRRED